MNLWLWLGALVILLLAGVAAYFHWQLYLRKKKQAQDLALLDEKRGEQIQRTVNSINILCRGLLDDQIGLTEVSIRVNVLSNALSLSEEHRECLSAFSQLAEASAHIPILEQWKALPTKQKLAFSREMSELEGKFGDFVRAAAKDIVQRDIFRAYCS